MNFIVEDMDLIVLLNPRITAVKMFSVLLKVRSSRKVYLIMYTMYLVNAFAQTVMLPHYMDIVKI